MADFRLGRLKFKWQGAWAAGTSYVIDDIVKYGANSYVCTTNHTAAANENLFYSSDIGNWSLHTEGLTSKGDWAASTWYKLNDVVKYGNNQYRVTTAHTSGTSFAAANFETYVEGLKFESTWVAGTVYQKGDIVNYGGYTYTAKRDHSGATDSPNLDPTNWDVLTTGFKNQGVYSASTNYAPGDLVRFGGYSYECKLNSIGNKPHDTTYWNVLAKGFEWNGNWAASNVYQKGDCVTANSNTYVCIADDVEGVAKSPANDPSGNYWNYIAQGGSAAQVLTTQGDLLYQSASGINRIALPAGSTGTAAEQAAASGQVLTVGGSPLLPRWEKNNVTGTVYYVSEEGSDANAGDQISRAFASIRYATDYVSANASPSATNPVTIYVKSGVYNETLPIHLPNFVTLVGDNIRNTVVNAKSGNSNEQDLALAQDVSHIRLGETITDSTGSKVAKVLDKVGTTVSILTVSGGSWTTTDKYVDIVDNKHADGRDLVINNKAFLAKEAYYAYNVANGSNVTGTQSTIESRLEAFIDALGYNIKHGSNNKVYDYGTAFVGGTPITGVQAQDQFLINNIRDNALKLFNGETITPSTGNNLTPVGFTGTSDTGNPKCAQVRSAATTLAAIITTASANGNMTHATKTEPYINIATATTVSNAESTMFFMATHTIIKDILMGGMTGFVPNGSNDKDIDNSTIKGVYVKLDPDSPITKSPYVQNCSAIGGAGVSVYCDGNAHKHFDNSATPSFKSMVFDSFTQVLEGGVGFYCKGTSAMEVVSCFTYYAHISYVSTGGGKIRAVSGNSSYGKYGCLSRGFNADEVTKNGKNEGLMLTTNPQAAKSGTFIAAGERITGGTSGAIGDLRSDQTAQANRIYYLPVKGTFQDGEVITGATSGATITLESSNAVTGSKGFVMILEGLDAAPAPGGSIEFVDNGSNDDPSSYVIQKSSYTTPDGRGTLTVNRAQLGSTAAAHDGTSQIAYFDTNTNTATLQNNISAGAAGPINMDVNAVTHMVVNGYLIVGTELFKIASFVDADTVSVERAQEGTTAAAHTAGDNIIILGTKSATQDELIEDMGVTGNARVKTSNVSFGAGDYIKIDNEFMKITAVTTDNTGIVIATLSDEKVIPAGDGQDFRIRYQYSQVRLTAHDFLEVGTGNRAQTNWPGLPQQQNEPSYEIDELRPGRVYYVSTDQDGNFAVGNFFKVEQSTGKATLNANAFDLTGLDTLRLGAIGAQLGATIDEFSTDGSLSQNTDSKVPTQKAVKTYVDNLSSVAGNLTVGGNLTVSGTTTTVDSTTLSVADKNIELAKVASPTDATCDGAGLTFKGSSDKTITWSNANDSFDFNQRVNLSAGLAFRIGNVDVLTGGGLGTGVTASSLTSVGTLTALTVAGNVTCSGTGSLKVPAGLENQRPTGAAGMLRFNTSSNSFEGYNGTAWSGIGGGNPWATKSANYTAAAGDRLFVDTTSSALTITLPSSPSVGDEVAFMDLAGTFGTNPLVIARNGQDIMNIAQDMTVDGANNAFALVYTGSTYGWKFLNLA